MDDCAIYLRWYLYRVVCSCSRGRSWTFDKWPLLLSPIPSDQSLLLRAKRQFRSSSMTQMASLDGQLLSDSDSGAGNCVARVLVTSVCLYRKA